MLYKTVMAALLSFGLVLGMAAVTDTNTVQAQQAVAAAQPNGKVGEAQTVKTAETDSRPIDEKAAKSAAMNSKTVHVPAESQQAEKETPAENSNPRKLLRKRKSSFP